MTFKEWSRECEVCDWRGKILAWATDHKACPTCGCNTREPDGPARSHGVIPDDLPGGLSIAHGLCNPDGTARTYYSKTEIRREATRRGLVIMGETPNVRREY